MKKRVLVVDDDADILASVADILVENGYDVVESSTSLHAYHLLRERWREFDAVVLDVMLESGHTGVELLDGLLRDGKGRPPVCAISAYQTEVLAALFHGAVPPLVHKPFMAEDLLRVVARLTGTRW